VEGRKKPALRRKARRIYRLDVPIDVKRNNEMMVHLIGCRRHAGAVGVMSARPCRLASVRRRSELPVNRVVLTSVSLADATGRGI
jgi:hypothetical protein